MLRSFILAATLIVCSVFAVCASSWKTLNLGGFSLKVPSSMVLEAGGIDSQAGSLQDASFQLGYDFGAYSDPLDAVAGATEFKTRQGTLDGKPARYVSFGRVGKNGQKQFCEGVHVPVVRAPVSADFGPVKLTMLVCGDASTTGAMAEQIFTSVTFQN